MKTAILEHMGIKKIILASFFGFFIFPLFAFGATATIYTQPYRYNPDGSIMIRNGQFVVNCGPCAVLDRMLFERDPATGRIIRNLIDLGGTVIVTETMPADGSITSVPTLVLPGGRDVSGPDAILTEARRHAAAQPIPPRRPIATPPPTNPVTPQRPPSIPVPIDPAFNYSVTCKPDPKPPATPTSYICEVRDDRGQRMPKLDYTIIPTTPPLPVPGSGGISPFNAIAQAVANNAPIFYNPTTDQVNVYPPRPVPPGNGGWEPVPVPKPKRYHTSIVSGPTLVKKEGKFYWEATMQACELNDEDEEVGCQRFTTRVPAADADTPDEARPLIEAQGANGPPPRPPRVTPNAPPPGGSVGSAPAGPSAEEMRRMQAEVDELRRRNDAAEAENERRRTNGRMPTPANP